MFLQNNSLQMRQEFVCQKFIWKRIPGSRVIELDGETESGGRSVKAIWWPLWAQGLNPSGILQRKIRAAAPGRAYGQGRMLIIYPSLVGGCSWLHKSSCTSGPSWAWPVHAVRQRNTGAWAWKLLILWEPFPEDLGWGGGWAKRIRVGYWQHLL